MCQYSTEVKTYKTPIQGRGHCPLPLFLHPRGLAGIADWSVYGQRSPGTAAEPDDGHADTVEDRLDRGQLVLHICLFGSLPCGAPDLFFYPAEYP